MKETTKPRWTDRGVSKVASWLVQDTTGEWHFYYAKPSATMEVFNYVQYHGRATKEKAVIHLDLKTLEHRS